MDVAHGKPTKADKAWAKRILNAIVLDAGALIAFERGDARMRALVREAMKDGVRLVIPTGVLGQVRRGVARRAPPRRRRPSTPGYRAHARENMTGKAVAGACP